MLIGSDQGSTVTVRIGHKDQLPGRMMQFWTWMVPVAGGFVSDAEGEDVGGESPK
jgi:hypothetical protein